MIWRFEEFELDLATLELRAGGDVVPIEPQVFQVLAHLVEHRDRVVTKEELLDEIWGSRFVSESALTSRIKSARRAVGDSGKDQRVIRTFHGRGYRFVLPIEDDSPPTRDVAVDPTAAARPSHLTLAVDQQFSFVGRRDLIDLALVAAEGASGGPQGLLLGGEPGVGKSRLAIEIGRVAAESLGMVVIGGRCEQHLASSLQPWLEALAMFVVDAPLEELHADTAGLAGPLRSVLPLLEQRLGADPSVAAGAPSDDYVLIDGIVTLIERASQRRPMLLVLDDVQWAGGATRSLASLLLRRGHARVLLVATFRTTIDDLDATTAEWLEGLEHTGATRADLSGLGAEDVGALVDSALGEAGRRHADDIWARSDGHSLFAVELIRDVIDGSSGDGLPPSVASLVQRRLDKLPADVASLVVAGATFGQEFELGVVATVAGLDEDQALDAVEVGLGARLLHEVADRADWFRFSHQLVPAAALDAMSSSRRVRLHARVAEELDRRGASGIEIAHHLLEASPVLDSREVVRRVRGVCDAALRTHQFDRAVELLERAARLDIDPRLRAELLTEFGAACNAAGQQQRALGGLMHAADVARTNGWDDLLAAAALGLWGQSPFRASRDETVIPLLDEAIARSDRLDDQTRARLLAKRAAFNLFSGALDERDALSARAVAVVGDASTPARLEVLEARWMAIASPARLFELVELDAELESLRKELGALSTDACAPEITLYWRGLGESLHRIADEIRNDPRQRRDVDQWRTTALDGAFALFAGDTDTARRLADRALPLGEEPWGEAGEVVHALVHLVADVLDGSGSDSVDRWRRVGRQVPSDAMRATQAWAEAAWGDRGQAEQLVEHVMPRIDLLRDNFMGGMGLVGLVEAVLLLDRADLIDELVAELMMLPGSGMFGHPWAPSFALADLLARLHRRTGDVEESARCGDEARALYDRLGAASFRGRLDANLG